MRRWFKRTWFRVRYGPIQEVTVDTINGIPCEIKFLGRKGGVVGYWAYGSFDPSLPYRGDL